LGGVEVEGSGLSDLGAKPAQDATVVGLYPLTGKTARVVAAVEVPASHISLVSQPEAATQLILQAVEATSRSQP
jgi:hypothetical protein